MSDKTRAAERSSSTHPLSDETLETSRLLVEFLHAAYATRRVPDDDAGAASANGPVGKPHGKTSPEVSTHAVRAAIHVHQHGERTVGQIASGLGISYGWASRVVEELEGAHYVIRSRGEDDRRIVRVRLDPSALEEVERAYRWRGRAVDEALEPLTDDERGAVRLFLRRVIDLLREDRPDQP
jgi:DNA-binding MarR family transcriptional regulator